MPFRGPLLPNDVNTPPGSHPYDQFYARPRYNVFYYLTGFSFLAFASGFTVCLFDISQVKQCVDHAEQMVDLLKSVGDQILQWGVAIVKEIMSRR